ncbi:MAG: efflux RND transporter periplasmic adaptor subunit [Kiritimatiellia bacterium]
MKKMVGLLCLVVLVAACVWRIHDLQNKKEGAGKKGGSRPPVPVLQIAAACKPMPVELRAFGTVEASTSVTIRAQVTGMLAESGFAEGAAIQAGQLLYRLDPRAFETDLRQAEAARARTLAQLTNAVTEARRMSELFDKKLLPENERDVSLMAVATLRATLLADDASVDRARILLGYCEIRSPIAGIAGRRQMDVGNLVTANTTPLVTINQVQPVDVSFSIPQQELARVYGRTEARDLAVEALLPEDAAHPEAGVLTFLDNSVDRTTGTITLKAQFANASRRLWSGQFVTVRMVVTIETNAVVIPYRAVQNGQKGTFVYLVQPDATVTDRLVTITRMVEEESVIGKGLEPGEVVVTDGQQLLKPGAAVKNAAETGKPAAGAGSGKPDAEARKAGRREP